jgi:hypothetical protein
MASIICQTLAGGDKVGVKKNTTNSKGRVLAELAKEFAAEKAEGAEAGAYTRPLLS